MSTLSFGAMSPATGTRANGFGASLLRAVRAVGNEWRARQAARSVDALSDAMLHDIGLTRGEIDRAVRCGRLGG